MAEERKCKHCGKLFVSANYKQKYCNPVCRIEYNKEKLMDKRKSCNTNQNEKKESIRHIASEAKAAGMSYGQYVAMNGL